MQNYITIIILFFFTYCTNNSSKYNSHQVKNYDIKNKSDIIVNNRDSIELDEINTIPDSIDGCSELLYVNKENKKLIFASNLQSFGMIKLDNNEIYFKKDTINSDALDDQNIHEEFNNEKYKIKINLKNIDILDESGQYNGEIILYQNDSIIYKRNVFGVIGC